MKETSKGWVVINENHPTGCEPYIVASTFAFTRRESIAKFIDRTNETWDYWHKKYNFRCVKAESAITTNN